MAGGKPNLKWEKQKSRPSNKADEIIYYDKKFLRIVTIAGLAVTVLVVVAVFITTFSIGSNLRELRFSVTTAPEDYIVGLMVFDVGRRKVAWRFLNLDEETDPTRRPDYISLELPDGTLIELCGGSEEGSQICMLSGEKGQQTNGQTMKEMLKRLRVNPHLYKVVLGVRNDDVIYPEVYTQRLLNSVGIE